MGDDFLWNRYGYLLLSGKCTSKALLNRIHFLYRLCSVYLQLIGLWIGTEQGNFFTLQIFQGLTSGAAIIVSQPMLLKIVGKEGRAFGISLWTSAVSLGPVFGPIVGAVITEQLSWRWLFFIHVPLVSISLLCMLPYLSFTKVKEQLNSKRSIVTLICFSIVILSFQYILDFGEHLGWMSNDSIKFSALILVVSIPVFIYLNSIEDCRVFDFSLLKDYQFLLPTVILCLGNGVIFTSIVVLPIWLRTGYGMPIIDAGIIVSVSSLVAAVISPLVGKHIKREYYSALSVMSLMITATSFFLMSKYSQETSMEYFIWTRLLFGVALTTFTLPLSVLSLANIPDHKIIDANAISMVFRIISANVFVSLGFAVWKELRFEAHAEFVANYAGPINQFGSENYAEGLQIYVSSLFTTVSMVDIFTYFGMIFLCSGIVMTLLSLNANRTRLNPRNYRK